MPVLRARDYPQHDADRCDEGPSALVQSCMAYLSRKRIRAIAPGKLHRRGHEDEHCNATVSSVALDDRRSPRATAGWTDMSRALQPWSAVGGVDDCWGPRGVGVEHTVYCHSSKRAVVRALM